MWQAGKWVKIGDVITENSEEGGPIKKKHY